MKTPRNNMRKSCSTPGVSISRRAILSRTLPPSTGSLGRRAPTAFCAALFLAGALVPAATGINGLLRISVLARAETTQSKSSLDESMHRHYDTAFRLQAAGHVAEADAEHKLFLAEALRHVANGRANIGEYALSVPIYEQAIQFAPKEFTLHLEYAEAALDADDPAKAKLLAQEALALLPEAADQKRAKTMHVLAQALWGTGERKQSIDEYKAAAALDPSFTNIYAVGTTELTLGDKVTATRIFTEIVAKFGDTATVRMQLGRAYALASDYPEAIQEFKKALAKDNKMLGLHYSLGAAMMQASGEAAYPEAEAEFRKELAIQPNDHLTYPQLGRITLARHDYKEAESDLIRANELDPGNPDTFRLSAQLYTEIGETAEAEAALRNAIAATPDPSRHHYETAAVHYQLGRLLWQSGDRDEAKKEMHISEDLTAQSRLQDESTLTGKPNVQSPLETTHAPKPEEVAEEKQFENQIGPAIASSYDNLGVHAAIGKRYAIAAAYFGRAAEWNPALTAIDNNWGQAAFEAQKFTEAVSPLSRSLQTHPEDAAIRAMLGISQYALGDYPKALETLQPLQGRLDMFPMLPLAYADSMMRAGDFRQGMQRLEAIVTDDPENAAAHLALAEAYRKDGRPQEAERQDQLANRLHVEHPVTTNNAAFEENSTTKN
jgi:tetratricopeptide (TPR) repeat protein